MEVFIISTTVILVFTAVTGLYYQVTSVKQKSQNKLDSSSKSQRLELENQHGFHVESYLTSLLYKVSFIDIRGINIGSPIQSANRIPITDLYTDLYVQKGMTNWDIESNGAGKSGITLSQMLEFRRHVIVVGNPGSGKTTFLRHVAYREITDNSRNLLPFLIDLPELFRYCKLQIEKRSKSSFIPSDIIGFLQDSLADDNLVTSYDEILATVLNFETIFLLDSFDELPDSDARIQIANLISSASSKWNFSRFVVTSRPVALSSESVPLDFEIVEIEPFRDSDIKAFLNSWSLHLYPQQASQRKQFYETLVSDIFANIHLKQLARNPVMLTCAAVLAFNNKRLPEGRAELLEGVMLWLIASRKGKRPAHETDSFVFTCYCELAYQMFTDDVASKNRIGKLAASNILKDEFFYGEGSDAIEFLDREVDQTGLLTIKGEGDLSFWHSWFLEYLAAKKIAGETDDKVTGWWSRISDDIFNPEWQEVLALVPACLARLGSNRVTLFFERVCVELEKLRIEDKIKNTGLTGRIIRELIANGHQPQLPQKWQEILCDVRIIFNEPVPNVSLNSRYEAAVAFGYDYKQRLISSDGSWISIPRGTFFMGASNDVESVDHDEYATLYEGPITRVSVPEFDIARHLTTVAEFNVFIQNEGYSSQEYWNEEGWSWIKTNEIRSPKDWENQLLYPNCPVTSLSWFEALAYCSWLSSTEESNLYDYTLPSESIWEYTARRMVPDNCRFPWGNQLMKGDDAEYNWAGSSLRKKTPVGMFPKSNTFDGVTDMFGNVEEWCMDSWTDNHHGHPIDGSPNLISDEDCRTVKGGSTIRFMRLCRPTYRSKTLKFNRYATIGFRPIRFKLESI